ncbi:MAG: hydrogenase expression protein HypE, partial [Chloroflexi bacterium]|nr:hydrogenase expression protein HypE [Chloroflexota bacterium]
MSSQNVVHILWLSGGSCEGCSMAVLGATAPKIEDLLLGHIPGLPCLALIHTATAFEAGAEYLSRLERAASGLLAPFVLVVEGSIFDPASAGDGFFSGLGEADGRPLTVSDWLDRLAPRAMAVIAIGTCAAWGGVPAARGNPTGAMSLGDYVGSAFRSLAGLPIINVPGCAPPGDNFTETLVYLLLHLAEQVPLELDEDHRPRWLYDETTQVTDAEWRA